MSFMIGGIWVWCCCSWLPVNANDVSVDQKDTHTHKHSEQRTEQTERSEREGERFIHTEAMMMTHKADEDDREEK